MAGRSAAGGAGRAIAALAAKVADLERCLAKDSGDVVEAAVVGQPVYEEAEGPVAARQVRPQARQAARRGIVRAGAVGPPGSHGGVRAGGVRLLRDRPERCAGRGDAETAGVRGRAAPAAGGDGVPGSGEAMPGVRGGQHRAGAGRGDRPGAVRAAGPRQHGTGGVRELPAGRPRREAGRRADRRACVSRVHRRDPRQGRGPARPVHLDRVKELLGAAAVLYADETPARTAGKLHYVHVACTEFLTAMHTGDRTKEAIDSGGILAGYTGTIVRDGYAGYDHLTGALHAWCGAHGLRDLAGLHRFDPDGQVWARAMADLLIDANAAATAARNAGQASLASTDLAGFQESYQRTIPSRTCRTNAPRCAGVDPGPVRGHEIHSSMTTRVEFCRPHVAPLAWNSSPLMDVGTVWTPKTGARFTQTVALLRAA